MARNHDGDGSYRREGDYYVWRRRVGPRGNQRNFVVKEKDYQTFKTEVEQRKLEIAVLTGNTSVAKTWGLMFDLWLAVKIVPPQHSRKTIRSYKDTVRLHLKPHLGTIRTRRITDVDLQKMVNALTTKGKITTAYYCIRLFKQCAAAMGHGDLAAQVTHKDKLTMPTKPRKVKRVLPSWEWDMVRDELESYTGKGNKEGKPLRDRHLLTFLVNAGLRISEGLGLLAIMVNTRERWAKIENQLEWYTDEKGIVRWELVPVKGKRNRIVPLTDDAIAAVRGAAALRANDQAKAGRGWNETGLVFCTESGRPYNPRNVRRSLDLVLKRINERRLLEELPPLDETGLHDLRRTMLTHYAKSEPRAHMVAAVAGHGNIATTAQYYIEAEKLDLIESMSVLQIGSKKVVGTDVGTEGVESGA